MKAVTVSTVWRSSVFYACVAATALLPAQQVDAGLNVNFQNSEHGAYTVGATNQVFPHIAVGGGWETGIVVVNMSATPMPYKIRFFNQDGSAMNVSYRIGPSPEVLVASAHAGELKVNGSVSLLLASSVPETRSGWAYLEYEAKNGRLGGYAVFRLRVSGRPDFEALVPLGAFDDSRFYVPFDNTDGFVAAMAIVNPGESEPTNVSVTAFGRVGEILLTAKFVLRSFEQTAFALSDRWPVLVNKAGVLLIEGSSGRLAGMGIRFNAAGGWAFSSVPILNWSGMFP